MFFSLALVKVCLGQGKDYPDFSKVDPRLDFRFGTDLIVYDAVQFAQGSRTFHRFVAPEFDFRIGLDLTPIGRFSIGPLIGINYSDKRNFDAEGIVMTTSGNESVSYYLRSKSLGFNSGIQIKAICFRKMNHRLIVSLATYYSHLVRQETWNSLSVEGDPSFYGRVKSVLQGGLALRYSYDLGHGIRIEPLLTLSYNAALIRPYTHTALNFPISPSLGLAFTFGKRGESSTPNLDSSKPSEP